MVLLLSVLLPPDLALVPLAQPASPKPKTEMNERPNNDLLTFDIVSNYLQVILVTCVA